MSDLGKRNRDESEEQVEAEGAAKKARTESEDGAAAVEAPAGEAEFVLVDQKDVPPAEEAEQVSSQEAIPVVEASTEAAAAPPALAPGLETGEAKWFDTKKGFGFITRDSDQTEIFFHFASVKVAAGYKGLKEGERVEFSLIKDSAGRDRADNITGPGGVDCQGIHDMYAQGGPGGGQSQPLVYPPHNTDPLAAGRIRGSCKWFNSQKGFGFIQIEGSEEELFVHQSEIKAGAGAFRSLAVDEKVEFEIQSDTGTKRKASNVTGPGGAPCVGQPKPQPMFDRGGYGGQQGGYGDQGGYGGGRGGYGAPQGGYGAPQGGYGGGYGGSSRGGYGAPAPGGYGGQQQSYGGYDQASRGQSSYGGSRGASSGYGASSGGSSYGAASQQGGYDSYSQGGGQGGRRDYGAPQGQGGY